MQAFHPVRALCGGEASARLGARIRLAAAAQRLDVLVDLAIDAALALDPDADLLGPFTTTDAVVEPLRFCKMIYLPTPFSSLFLEQ